MERNFCIFLISNFFLGEKGEKKKMEITTKLNESLLNSNLVVGNYQTNQIYPFRSDIY